MTIFFLLLDAIGGLLLAFVIFTFLRLKKSWKYKHKFEGVILDSDIKDGLMGYTVSFDVEGKKEQRSYSIKMPTTEKKQMNYINNFLVGYQKGNKFTLMCETSDASTEVIPNDNPKKTFIVLVVLLLIFHVSALLTNGSLFFALGM